MIHYTKYLWWTQESQLFESTTLDEPVKKYPHLDPDDPILKLFKNDIIRKFVSLSQRALTPDEKRKVHEVLSENRQVFSL